jgi:integrase
VSARRGHNEGTIYQRPNGKFQAQISLPDGTRKTFTADTKRDVQRLLQQARLDATAGQLTGNSKQTLGEYLDWWLKTIEPSVRFTTFRSYEINVKRIYAKLATIRLDALKPLQIQDSYSALLANGLSARSVEFTHTVLHAALRHATRLGLITRNPVDSVIPPRPTRYEAGRCLRRKPSSSSMPPRPQRCEPC